MRTICVANQKGGVGKTTLSTHLAHLAMEEGQRVLLVDMDRQASLSMYFGENADSHRVSERDNSARLFDAAAKLPPAPLDLLQYPGCALFRASPDISNVKAADRETIQLPRKHLAALAHRFDVAIIDTPGHLGFHPPLTIGALVAADAVVSPCAVGLFETRALVELWQYLGRVRSEGYNPQLDLMGLLPSKVNSRSRSEMDALKALRTHFGSAILPFELNERAAVKQAVMARKPVWYRPRGASHRRAAKEWRKGMQYVMSRLAETPPGRTR